MLTSWFNDFDQFPPRQMKDCKLCFLIEVSTFEKGDNAIFMQTTEKPSDDLAVAPLSYRNIIHFWI